MMIDTRRPRGARRGMVVVLVALLMPLVVGAMAISLDGGLLYLQRRQAQSAADAAALAGADSVALGTRASACAAASAVAESNAAKLVDCDVGDDAVEVVVELTGDAPLALGRTVRARSRAEISVPRADEGA